MLQDHRNVLAIVLCLAALTPAHAQGPMFAPASSSPVKVGPGPGLIILADINHDGWPDLVIARGDQDSVDVFLDDGTGRFHRAPGSPFTADPRIAPLNKRSHGRNNTFATLLGDGKEGFSPGPLSRVGPEGSKDFRAFAFGDVDGDGRVAAVISSSGTGSSPGTEPGMVEVRLGDGTGAFPQPLAPIASVPPSPQFLALGDLSGDGRLDLAISHGGKILSVFLNDVKGAFPPAPGWPYTLAMPATGLVLVDVNGDGRNDICAATVNSVTVLLSLRGGFMPAPGSPFRAGPGSYYLAVGDINEDGKPDIAVSNFEGDTVTLLLGQ